MAFCVYECVFHAHHLQRKENLLNLGTAFSEYFYNFYAIYVQFTSTITPLIRGILRTKSTFFHALSSGSDQPFAASRRHIRNMTKIKNSNILDDPWTFGTMATGTSTVRMVHWITAHVSSARPNGIRPEGASSLYGVTSHLFFSVCVCVWVFSCVIFNFHFLFFISWILISAGPKTISHYILWINW